MNWSEQFDRAANQLEDDLTAGLITQAEYNSELWAMRREYQDCAQEAAEDAYRNELEKW